MNTRQIRPTPMTEDQLEHVKKEITRIYFFLISKTGHDPMIVEFMKLSALVEHNFIENYISNLNLLLYEGAT